MPNKAFATLLAALLLMLVLACAGPAAAAIPAGNTGWSWANPLPQGNALDTIAVSGGRVWAGGATGTLLRSDDGGASWIATRTGLLDDIRTIEAISPTSVVFAGRCALRRTDDGGATVKRLAWGSSDDTCPAQIRAVTFPSPLIGYLLLTNGDVYATGDGGDSWNKRGVAPGSTATGGTDAVRDIEFTGVSTGVLSVGSRVLQTVDAGANWTPVAAAVTGAGLFNFEFLNSNDGYAVGDHSDVLVTTDGGASWNVVAGDFVTRTASLTSLSCADVSTCVATLATSPASTSVLRTVDGGAHWTPISTGASAVNAAGFAGGSRVVAAGAMGAIQLSSDAGATWFRVNSVAEGKFTGLRSDSARSALVFGNEGAIARSTDGGATWASLEEVRGAEILDATAVGGKRIYSVDTDGYVARTTDGGRSWITFNAGPLGVNPQALFAWGSSRLLIVGSKGVRISTKGGPKSKAVAGPISKLTLRAIDGAGANVYA
ncbi:MAG: YCF48-related protein, partial [Solirubrobacterales bacterium]